MAPVQCATFFFLTYSVRTAPSRHEFHEVIFVTEICDRVGLDCDLFWEVLYDTQLDRGQHYICTQARVQFF